MNEDPSPTWNKHQRFVMNRRRFLKAAGLAGSAGLMAGCGDLLTASAPGCRPVARPIRVRGIVRSRGTGVGGVPVTDGLRVVASEPDGTWELVTDGTRPSIYLSVPDGYALPRNSRGVARFHQPLDWCGLDRTDEVGMTFELVPLNRSAENHHLVLLADPQVAEPSDIRHLSENLVPELRALSHDLAGHEVFGVACGDLVHDRPILFPAYDEAMSRAGIPLLQVLGNHDIVSSASTDETAKAAFARRYGPSWYSFDRGSVHYVVLDNVYHHGDGYRGYVAEDQLAWLAQDLSFVEPGRTVVVCQHIPMRGTRHRRDGARVSRSKQSVRNGDELLRLLEPFRAHILTGHTHECDHRIEAGFEEHQNGAVCGAWWAGPVCPDGTPRGYVIYEAKGEELRWRYKAMGMNAGTQMTLHPPGADPELPGAFVANVWFHDPAWIVQWYQDGQSMGAMQRRTGFDPAAVTHYGAAGHPERHPWIRPFPTDHLFHATPATDWAEITVEATDRFGRVFSSVLRRGDAAPLPPQIHGDRPHRDHHAATITPGENDRE